MKLDITGLARQFYVMDYLLATPKIYTESLLVNREIKKRMSALQDTYEEFCDNFAKILHDYLVTICLGEFRYAASESSACPKDYYGYDMNREDIYLDAKNIYNIKTVLPVIEKSFRYFFWKKGMGGVNWANIAKAAMLYGTMPNNTFIDYCMDLFHNGNSCFDKPYMFLYCSCYNKFLNLKKNEPELLSKEFLIHVKNSCSTHNQFLDSVYFNLLKLEFAYPILNEYLKYKLEIIHNFSYIASNRTKGYTGTKEITFDPSTWAIKTEHAKITLEALSKGYNPPPFFYCKEEVNFLSGKNYIGEKYKKVENIFADIFSLSVFKPYNEFEIGDWVKADSKTKNPDSFNGFLEKYPKGIFKIIHKDFDDYTGEPIYHAFKKGKWKFFGCDLVKVDPPEQKEEEQIEYEFKKGDLVKAISKSVYQDSFDGFIEKYPSQEFVIGMIEPYAEDPDILIYSPQKGAYFFTAKDLIPVKIEYEFKKGDLVKAISKSKFPDSFEEFKQACPDQEFVIDYLEPNLDNPGEYLYGPNTNFLFTKEDLVPVSKCGLVTKKIDGWEIDLSKLKTSKKKPVKPKKKSNPTKKEGIENYASIR